MIHQVDDCVRRSRNLRNRLIVAIVYDIITRKYIYIISRPPSPHEHVFPVFSEVNVNWLPFPRYIQVHKMVVSSRAAVAYEPL